MQNVQRRCTDHKMHLYETGRAGAIVRLRPTASMAGRHYFEIRVTANAAATMTLPFTIWMPKLDTANMQTIPAPTTREVVLTNPLSRAWKCTSRRAR